MPTIWTIPANGIQPQGGNALALVGCHIAIVNDAQGQHYAFEKPDGTIKTQSLGFSLPALPFNFPTFTSKLGGSTSLPWFIRLTSGGPSASQMGGQAANNSFVSGEGVNPADVDPDTFTAQASVGVGEGEGYDAAAAAASSKQ